MDVGVLAGGARQGARFMSHMYIHDAFGSKRSDGSEVRALEGARSGTSGHAAAH